MTKPTKNSEGKPCAPEAGFWAQFPGGWRQLYGGIFTMGVSVELHNFVARTDIDWARSFHPDSVEICLNLEGEATVTSEAKTIILSTASVATYAIGGSPIAAIRKAGQRHQFITVEMSRAFLRQRFPVRPEGVLPLIASAFEDGPMQSGLAAIRPFTPAQSVALRGIAEPPVHSVALPLWYEARVAEWLAECLFDPEDELFCHRQQRTDRERIEKVKAILVREFIEPPTLETLAQRVGMSSFYLSRTFSRVARETIAQHIRRLRVEHAAELLARGTHNVTEAAFAVGYSSLGHFARNFTAVLGRTPSQYTASTGG